MTRAQALADFQTALHVSHSQIFTYLGCSLKYRFQYVEQRPQERVSIALPFGSAVHSAIERYYRSIKDKGVVEPLETIQEVFADSLAVDLDKREVPILYKKETPNRQSVIEMGRGLLKEFYDGIDLTGFEVVDVELPLTARLYTEEGQATDLMVTGILDVVLKDAVGNIIAVDNKIANAVLAGIDARVFIPCKSWLCSDCQYAKACGQW